MSKTTTTVGTTMEMTITIVLPLSAKKQESYAGLNISRIKDNKISKNLMTNYRENRQHTYISTSNTLAIILPE